MTRPVMMTLEQPTLAQPASNGLLGQRFEETRREVVRLRRTNDYLRETLATHEHLIRLLEGIRECLERRNDDLMEICACKNFLRPENVHLVNDDLKDLYSQYYQAKSTQGLPVNLSTSTTVNSSSPSNEKFLNGKCPKGSPPQVETSTLSPTSSTNHHQTMPSPSSSSLSPSFSSSSSSAPSTGTRSSSSPASQLSTLSSSAAALLSLSAAIAAVNATSSTDLTNSNNKAATSVEDEQISNGTSLKTETELETDESDASKESNSQDKLQTLGEPNETSIEVKKEVEDGIDSDDDNLEIEIDDERPSDNEDEEGDKFYDEMQTDESQDASRSGSESTTRLPILKSMLSPVEQLEEKIEINLNPNDFFAGNATEATNNEASDLSRKSDLSKSIREPASSNASENGREVSTSSNSFSVSSSSSPPSGDKSSSNSSMMSNAAAAAAAALFANSLQQLNPSMAPSSLPNMSPPISNLRIALSSNSSRKPPVPPSMLATLAAANGLNINMDAIRPHKCHWPDCKFATKDRKTLRTHMRIHTKEKPFKCSFPNCSYETGDPSNYRKHKRRHIAHTIFACDFEGCNFTTNKPDFMQSHIAIHKGLKPFLCDFENCNSSFYTRSKLEAHRRKHLASGEFPMSLTHVEDKDKPIICTYPNCGKRFINAAGLAGHEVTHLATHNKYGAFLAEHEREKPVVCNFPNCGKRFLNTAGLAGHEVTHRNFISQNMGAIFKNLSFNQLKNLGIFSVANLKQQQQSGQNVSNTQQQQLQHLQAQLLLQGLQNGPVEGVKSQSVSNGKNGEVIVVDI